MTAPRDPYAPDAPREPRLPRQLEPLETSELAARGRQVELDGVSIEGSCDEEPVDGEGSTWERSALRGASLGGAHLDFVTWSDLEIDRSDLSNVSVLRSSVQRVHARESRLLGIGLGESRIEDAVFEGCNLDFARLRFAELTRVVFRDCQLRDADFANAKLVSVAFEQCDLSRVDLNQTTFARCTITGCTLEDAKGIDRLTGVSMAWNDVVELAPVFAAALGVRVADH